jgi:hypothetical protein
MGPRIHVLIENLGEMEAHEPAARTRQAESDGSFLKTDRGSDGDGISERHPFSVTTDRAVRPDFSFRKSIKQRLNGWIQRVFVGGHR